MVLIWLLKVSKSTKPLSGHYNDSKTNQKSYLFKTTSILGAEISKPTSLKLPKTEIVKSEINMPRQCSIQNELVNGGGEHRLYWFKHGSGESPPGFIYVHGNTSDGCVRSSEADCLSQTCEYNLPKKKFSSSQTGIYCALATCGEALFGKVSELNPGKCEHFNISDTFG